MNTFDARPLLLAATTALLLSANSAPLAQVPAAAGPNGVTIDASGGTGVDWALKQDEIKNDATGQWAVSATSSSAYNDATGHDRFSAWQAAGAPNVDQEGDNGNAWAPKTPDAGIEWIDVSFAKAVAATGVRIRESAGAGAVIKIDLIDTQGAVHALWSGKDPTKGLNYLMLSFPKTDFKVNHVKITLATNLIPGWNEIDAVQLLGSDN